MIRPTYDQLSKSIAATHGDLSKIRDEMLGEHSKRMAADAIKGLEAVLACPRAVTILAEKLNQQPARPEPGPDPRPDLPKCVCSGQSCGRCAGRCKCTTCCHR